MGGTAPDGAGQEPPAATGWRRLPRVADFWRLWLVGLVIFIVRWMEMLAVAVFAYQRTESAFVVAGLTMLRMLPMGLFGAFIGVVADRVERRTALIIVVLSMLGSSAILASLAYHDRLEIWHLALASFFNGIGWTTDNPVRRMMVGEVVGSEHMSMAMSIDIGSNNACRVVGPAIGGLVLAHVGIHGAFGLGALLYLIALASAFGIRYRNSFIASTSELLFARIGAATRVITATPMLSGTLLITMLFNIFGWPFTSMIPVIAKDRLNLSADATGLLAAMDGVGAFFGAVAVALYVTPSRFGVVYIGSVAVYLVALMGFAWSPTVLLAAALLFVMGFVQSGFSIMQATLVFRGAPPQMRGQMLGALSVCIGVGPVGFIAIGVLSDMIGAPYTALVTGIGGLCVLALTRRFWRTVWASR